MDIITGFNFLFKLFYKHFLNNNQKILVNYPYLLDFTKYLVTTVMLHYDGIESLRDCIDGRLVEVSS